MRLVVTARTAAIFVAALFLQAACEQEPCKAIGNLFYERHYQVIADTLRSEPIANIMQLTSSFPRLRFNASMSVASHAPEEDVLVEKLIRVFESAHKNEAGEGKVNALYDSYVPTLGYHRWFRALWTAISTVTKDSDPMFLTSNSKEQTGYLDWHWLAAHASAAARDRVSLLAYFGSRVDLSFMVHGAAWATITNASAAGLFRFSDDLRSRAQSTPRSGSKPRKPRGGDGAVELLLAPGFSALRKVCPWSALHGDDGPEAAKRSAQQHGAEEQGGEEDYPWLAECLHGLGHGVFMASVESLAAAGKSLSVPEVMRRSAALGSAILNGDGPSTAAILRHGTVATKLSSWMVAADVGSAAHEFERDRDRYGWRDGSAAAWRDGYAALVGAFPASCAAALTPSIPRRWTAAATSAATTAAAATSAAHAGAGPSKSDDDWAVSACLSQGGKYGFRPLGSAECLALARAEATGGVGSLTCATMSGAVGLMGLHGGNVHRALRACRSSYLESLEAAAAYSYSMLHPHYKACVGGVSRAAREVASGPYAGHPGDQFSVDAHAGYSQSLREGRGVSEWGAVKLCSPLLASILAKEKQKQAAHKAPMAQKEEAVPTGEDLSAFGACVAGAVERHPRRGEANGRCMLGLVHEVERARAEMLTAGYKRRVDRN